MMPPTSKRVPSQRDARSEVSTTTSFIFRVITKRQKEAFITIAPSFTDIRVHKSTNFSPFEKHCRIFYLIRLVREHYYSYFYYI